MSIAFFLAAGRVGIYGFFILLCLFGQQEKITLRTPL